MRIALDAMGGDFAPKSVINGAHISLLHHPGVKFLIFGDVNKIEPLLKKHPALEKVSEVIHTENAVSAHEKPSVALRQGKDSSMQLAINSVKEGKADAVVSGGNTGALMAMSKLTLRTLPGIDRPAICSLFPTKRGQSVMLDLGANSECAADNLFQFGIMGEAFARAVLGIKEPTIGLLNIGSEAGKGVDSVRQASEMLQTTHLPIKFHGFVEGHDIAAGTVDVIVTDGFTGNIALKTAEGVGKLCVEYLKMGLTSSFSAKIGALLAKPALMSIKKKMDPRAHNGAMFLGLNGIVVKSHGGMDHVGYAHAIDVAADLIKGKVNQRIIDEIGFVQQNDALVE
jgi:glycerol-3-phosphate acyltransferase PlsX